MKKIKEKFLLAVFLSVSIISMAQIPTRDLAIYLKLDSNTVDVVTKQVTGIRPSTNISYDTDRFERSNHCAHFDGTSNMSVSMGSGSYSFWFKFTSTEKMTLMYMSEGNGLAQLLIYADSGKIYTRCTYVGKVKVDVTNSIAYNDNKFHHYYFTSDQISAIPSKGWVNIIIDSTSTHWIDTDTWFMPWWGGTSDGIVHLGYNSFKGDIDDYISYNSADFYTILPAVFSYKPPFITSYNYYPDSTLNIYGNNFQNSGGANTILFNGDTTTNFTVLNDTMITTKVPSTVKDGYLGIVKGFDTCYSPKSFTRPITNTGISSIERTTFNIYPNPATSEIFIDDLPTGYAVEIKNILGQIIYQATSTKNGLYNISGIDKGIYFISIKDVQSNIVASKKLIKL